MADVGQWNSLNPHLNRRDFLPREVIPSREALPRGAPCTLLGAVALGIYLVSAPSRARTKLLGVLSPSVFSASVHPIPPGVTDTSNLNGSLAWGMPRALLCITGIPAFSKTTGGSDPRSHTCPFFTNCIRGRGIAPGEESRWSKTPKSLRKARTSFMFLGVG